MMTLLEGRGYPELDPVPEGVERPFWSVVIPVHNRFDYLEECLRSVIAQRNGSEYMEVIVWDTSETDQGCIELLSKMDLLCKGIRYKHFDDAGIVNNWNDAIRFSFGHWIHLLHDDDFVEPGFYAAIEGMVRDKPSYGAAYTGYWHLEGGKRTQGRRYHGNHAGYLTDMPTAMASGNFLVPPCVAIKRTIHEEIGLYRPDLLFVSDWEMYMRAACFAKWWHDPRPLATYRHHGKNDGITIAVAGKWESVRKASALSEAYYPPGIKDQVQDTARRSWWGLCLHDAIMALARNDERNGRELTEEALKFAERMDFESVCTELDSRGFSRSFLGV